MSEVQARQKFRYDQVGLLIIAILQKPHDGVIFDPKIPFVLKFCSSETVRNRFGFIRVWARNGFSKGVIGFEFHGKKLNLFRFQAMKMDLDSSILNGFGF